MRPEDAVGISQLMYRAYGGSYFNADVYYPERVAAQNATARWCRSLPALPTAMLPGTTRWR